MTDAAQKFHLSIGKNVPTVVTQVYGIPPAQVLLLIAECWLERFSQDWVQLLMENRCQIPPTKHHLSTGERVSSFLWFLLREKVTKNYIYSRMMMVIIWW